MNFSSDIRNTEENMRFKYGKKTYVIYCTIITAIILTFSSLPFIYVDVTSQSRGIIRAKEDNVSLATIVQGEVIYVNMANNQTVKKGDTLMIIDSQTSQVQTETQKNLIAEQTKQMEDLTLLCTPAFSGKGLKTGKYKKEWSKYNETKRSLLVIESQIKKELSRLKNGVDAGVVSSFEFDQKMYEFEQNKASLKKLKEEQLNIWITEKQQLEETLITAKGELNQLNASISNYIVFAPIDGTIINYSGVRKGSYVYSGQNITELSPDDNLIAECYISTTDIGYIRKGQNVQLQFDAFNHNQWGLGSAIVESIDKNITITESTSFFRVLCNLTAKSLRLKNGYTTDIKKGNTFTARFIITERSIWDLLFDKIDDWFNPKIIDKNE